jgi:hypothetical protein
MPREGNKIISGNQSEAQKINYDPQTPGDWTVKPNNIADALDEARASGGGASTFVALTDTPSSLVGNADKIVHVNAGETALSFGTVKHPSANKLSDLTTIQSGSATSMTILNSTGNIIGAFVGIGSVTDYLVVAASVGAGVKLSTVSADTNMQLVSTGTGDVELTPGTSGAVNVTIGNLEMAAATSSIDFTTGPGSIQHTGTDVLTFASATLMSSNVPHRFDTAAYFAVTDHGTTGGTITINATNTSIKHSITLNAATTFNFTTHLASGQRADWVFDVWNHSTPTTLAWQKDGSASPPGVTWPGGVVKVLTLAADAKDTYRVHWNGTGYEITSAQNFG